MMTTISWDSSNKTVEIPQQETEAKLSLGTFIYNHKYTIIVARVIKNKSLFFIYLIFSPS